MAKINFKSIFDGVSLAVNAAFPDSKVHGGETSQGVAAGDFNVTLASAEHNKEVGQRFKRTPLVDVIYYPANGAADCYDKADALTLALESITTPEGDIIHATSCNWKVEDDVLHVLLTYDHHIYIPQTHEPMETLRIEQEE